MITPARHAPGSSGERSTRDRYALSDEELFREGIEAFAQYGVAISYSRLRRLIKRWRASAASEHEFGDWVLTYADPTGEIAVSRVLGGRRG